MAQRWDTGLFRSHGSAVGVTLVGPQIGGISRLLAIAQSVRAGDRRGAGGAEEAAVA